MRYKATSWWMLGIERFFVIPETEWIDQLIQGGPTGRAISEKITAQTCDMARAKMIAEALNAMPERITP